MNFISAFETLTRLYEEHDWTAGGSLPPKYLNENFELESRSTDLNKLARLLSQQLFGADISKVETIVVKTFASKNCFGSDSCIAILIDPDGAVVQKTVAENYLKQAVAILNGLSYQPETATIELQEGKHWIVLDKISQVTTKMIETIGS